MGEFLRMGEPGPLVLIHCPVHSKGFQHVHKVLCGWSWNMILCKLLATLAQLILYPFLQTLAFPAAVLLSDNMYSTLKGCLHC